MLLAGAELIANERSRGGTYVLDEDVPWRFVVHTTEVVPSSLAGARALAGRHAYPPHLWAWPEKGWVGQTVPLDRAAFALLHRASDPPTNKMRAIQVEVIGKAAETPGWPVEWWTWLGERVLRPVTVTGYRINLDLTAPTTGSDGYGLRGRVRMSWAAWRGFGGVCCHANVPGNEHWDIGAGRLDLIAQAARLPDDVEDDEMRDYIIQAAGRPAALLRGEKLVKFEDPVTVTQFQKQDVPTLNVTANDYDHLDAALGG